MSRLLVTGGCGFIGRHLCAALAARGEALTVLDDLSTGSADALPRGTRLIEGDICDPSAIARALEGAEAVLHLAAISSVEACTARRAETGRVNLGGTRALLAQSAVRPVVFTSSAAIYGDQTVSPVPETAMPRPLSPYAEDKLASEGLLAASGAPAIALRPFNVYGPGQPPGSPYSGVITRFAERAAAGHALRVNGDGLQTRDFIHVRDVARGLVLALDRARAAPPGQFEALNLCSGRALTILDLARLVASRTGSPVTPLHGPARPGDIRHSCGDPARARARLGFAAEIDIATGLADLLPSPKERVGK